MSVLFLLTCGAFEHFFGHWVAFAKEAGLEVLLCERAVGIERHFVPWCAKEKKKEGKEEVFVQQQEQQQKSFPYR